MSVRIKDLNKILHAESANIIMIVNRDWSWIYKAMVRKQFLVAFEDCLQVSDQVAYTAPDVILEGWGVRVS